MLRAMVDETIVLGRAEALSTARTYSWSATTDSSPSRSPDPRDVCIRFDRLELKRILNTYGRMVMAGEWRDYGIAGLSDRAVFSIFRHAAEAPLYRVEKHPSLARKQGAWAVFGQGGQILNRGHELPLVLRVFEKGKFSVVD